MLTEKSGFWRSKTWNHTSSGSGPAWGACDPAGTGVILDLGRVKDMCEVLDLDSSGRGKHPIINRILSLGAEP